MQCKVRREAKTYDSHDVRTTQQPDAAKRIDPYEIERCRQLTNASRMRMTCFWQEQIDKNHLKEAP